jgi:hypothetical protein
MRRILSFLAAVVLLVDAAAAVYMARETYNTAFDSWLGALITEVGPSSSLAIQTFTVGNTIDHNTRTNLAVDANTATQLAVGLTARGTPPDHQADVADLIAKLRAYADAATTLGHCLRADDCGVDFVALNSTLSDVITSLSRVHVDATPRRGAPFS